MQNLKTVNIKGKEYVEVNERLKYFRSNEAYKGYSLLTEVIEITEKRAVFKAVIKDAEGNVKAEGLAYEEHGSSFINKTSYIENCETSAWGRALANLGIGIDTSVASSNEVQNAVNNQDKDKAETSSESKDEQSETKKVVVANSYDIRADLKEKGFKYNSSNQSWEKEITSQTAAMYANVIGEFIAEKKSKATVEIV